jgi:hypothetical protein
VSDRNAPAANRGAQVSAGRRDTNSVPKTSGTTVDDAPLFDVTVNAYGTGFTTRDEAIAAVEDASDAWDRSVIDQAIEAVGRRNVIFSANEVRPLLPKVRAALIGARFLAMAKAGKLEFVGFTTSTDPGAHSALLRRWRWVH